MTRPGTGLSQWALVDEGWGRKAVDFATLSEPGNCREYVAVQHRLGVDAGDRLLDVACGSGTTPHAVAEIHRVLRPGGRAGITVWGHLKISPGAWALAPFRLAAAEKVSNQAVMVSLGRPGAGEQLLESYGFLDVERLDVPFAWEFADPQLYARALAATGPWSHAAGDREVARHRTVRILHVR